MNTEGSVFIAFFNLFFLNPKRTPYLFWVERIVIAVENVGYQHDEYN